MMRIRPYLFLALLVCALMITSCAGLRPASAVAPPRLQLPTLSLQPCQLAQLPEAPTQADLEIAYAARGSALVACDAARNLAVETLEAERALQDRWRALEAGTPPLWRRLIG